VFWNRSKHPESTLQHLDRRDTLMWNAVVLLLLCLGVTVAIVYIALMATSPTAPFPASQTPGLLAGSLCGVIGLFCVYGLFKHHQMQRLRSEIIETRVREESLRSRLLGLSSLLEGIAQVAMYLDIDDVMETLADRVRGTMGADQVSLMLLNARTNELECKAVAGMDAEFVRGARVRMGESISGRVAAQNRSIVLNRDDIASRFPAHEKPGRGIASALCVPLALNDKVVGVLNVNRLGSAAPFTDEDAGLLTVFAAHATIAIQRIQARRDDERVREQQKMEALGKLAGGVAHDFNNMLTVILNCAATLQSASNGNPPVRASADRILGAASRCASLTRQLLAFGRRQIVQPQVMDMNACVSSLAEVFRAVIREDIQLATHFSLEPGYVNADPSQIEQVVLHLVLNARDAMPQGGFLTVETATAMLDPAAAKQCGGIEPGSYVVLRVKDTSEGMDAETQKHVFEPFFAAPGLDAGRGLGLATANAVVKEGGGHIAVASEPGQGNLFEVYLPSVPRPTAAASAKLRDPGSSPGGVILLTEDEEAVRDLVREILEMNGYTVHAAPQGADALRFSETSGTAIDLLLTDVILPGMSSKELALRLTRQRPQLRVLFMSGYTGDVLDRHGIAMTGSSFLPKPFTPDGLVAKVREALAGPPPKFEEGASLDKAA